MVPPRRSQPTVLCRECGPCRLPHRALVYGARALPVRGQDNRDTVPRSSVFSRSALGYTGRESPPVSAGGLREIAPLAWRPDGIPGSHAGGLAPRVSSLPAVYRPLLLEPLAQAPLSTNCLWLILTGRFVRCDRNAVL